MSDSNNGGASAQRLHPGRAWDTEAVRREGALQAYRGRDNDATHEDAKAERDRDIRTRLMICVTCCCCNAACSSGNRATMAWTQKSSDLRRYHFFFLQSLLLSSYTRRRCLPSTIFWTSRGHRCRPLFPPPRVRVFVFIAQGFSIPTAVDLRRMLLAHARALSVNHFLCKERPLFLRTR